ncbi:zf-CCHC domain-containing protein [Tanacetum coccineum]
MVNLFGNQEKKRSHSDKEMRRKERVNENVLDAVIQIISLAIVQCGDPNHLIGDCPKPSRNKDQKAFIGGSWSDSENDVEDKTNDETCLMDQSSNEVTLNSSCYSDNASSLDNYNMKIEYDSLCEISFKIINKNKILKIKRDLLEKEILELNEKIKKLERSKEIEIACKSYDELKLENAKLKETQVKFVKFDKSANSLREMLNNQESPRCKIGLGLDSDKASTSGTKTMSFVGSSAEKGMDGSTIKGHGSTLPGSVSRKDDKKGTKHICIPPLSSRLDFVITRKKLIHNSIDESKRSSLKLSLKSGLVCLRTFLELDEWIKDSGCSKHMTDNKSLFSTYKAYDREPKNVNEALKDESWVVAMQEELNQFIANDVWELVPLPISQSVIGTKWVFRNKLDENGIVSRNKARLVAQGYNQQEGIDYDETYALFEMSMMGELNFFLGLQIKQMEDGIFFNQSKYIKEMLKKFGLEDSKPTKTLMSTEIKLTKDDEAASVDSSKYQENPKSTHLESVKRIEELVT